jgi:hypothetical protein
MTFSYGTGQNIRVSARMAPPRLALGQRGTVPASVGTLCRTAILAESPMSMAPFGLFCHSGPVLGQIKQRVQCFGIRSDLGHLQAIPRNKPIFLRRIHRHRESLLCASPVPRARNGIQALAVPGSRPKISNGNVLWNWGIAKIYVRPQLAEIRAQLTQRGRPLSAASQFRRILSLLWACLYLRRFLRNLGPAPAGLSLGPSSLLGPCCTTVRQKRLTSLGPPGRSNFREPQVFPCPGGGVREPAGWGRSLGGVGGHDESLFP